MSGLDDFEQSVETELNTVKELFRTKMKSVNDLLIMLHLYSSNWLTLNRKLISAEKELDSAVAIFKKPWMINKQERFDIPVIPRAILKQRIVFQKALI